MTEKEFENLKVGDKVWIITDWFSTIDEGMKALQMEVAGKDEDKHNIQCIGCSLVSDHCYLTKAEAWEAEVKEYEKAVKGEEEYLAKKQATLERYKAELAKAKEEEKEGRWWVHYSEGTVFNSRYVRNRSTNLVYYATEQEAYSALADYYKGKYEEALSKACVVRYFVCGKRIITLHDCYEFLGGNFYGYDYDGQKHCSVHRGEDIFPTRQEAEAELERRKK